MKRKPLSSLVPPEIQNFPGWAEVEEALIRQATITVDKYVAEHGDTPEDRAEAQARLDAENLSARKEKGVKKLVKFHFSPMNLRFRHLF